MASDNLITWSFSRVSAYISCSLQFYFRYVAQIPPSLVSGNLLLGSGIHKGHQLLYEGMQKGEIPPLRTVIEGVVEEILQRKTTSPPIKFSNDGNLDTLIHEAKLLTEVLAESIEPEEVIAIDHEEVVQISDGNGYLASLKVIYDLIVRDRSGQETIVDLKTARTFPEERCKFDLQPTCYALARKLSTGQIPSFRFDVLLKRKCPSFTSYEATRDEASFIRLLGIIKAVERGVESGVFIPNRASISCANCGFQEKCADWRG